MIPGGRPLPARRARVAGAALATWLLLALLPSPTWAQAMDRACVADAKALCKGQKPGDGRVLACLQQHEAELSPGCKDKLPALTQCAQEVQAVCGDVTRPRQLRACLSEHKGQISPQCAALSG